MNKTKIKNEIKSEHQIFKGKIVQIVNCEVQYWSDYFPQPTEFEFIVENAEAKKITVTGCFREIYLYQNQKVLLVIGPNHREPEKFSLTILIDLKLELLWRELFLDSGSNTIKKSFYASLIFMLKILIGLSIIYLPFKGLEFYTSFSYQMITMVIMCWVAVIGYIHRYLYRSAIYFDAIFEMIGFEHAENIEISDFSLEHLELKTLNDPSPYMEEETFDLKTMYLSTEKKEFKSITQVN